jgi:hypothetical protein
MLKSFRDLLAVRWMKKRWLNYRIVREYSYESLEQEVGEK